MSELIGDKEVERYKRKIELFHQKTANEEMLESEYQKLWDQTFNGIVPFTERGLKTRAFVLEKIAERLKEKENALESDEARRNPGYRSWCAGAENELIEIENLIRNPKEE